MIPHRSLSRDTSENGVSSRVEACRKRLRMIRANQRGPIDTVEPATISVASTVDAGAERSTGQSVIEARVGRLDEVGIT
jgi:hypothetical protein